jgi:hypothetical protein
MMVDISVVIHMSEQSPSRTYALSGLLPMTRDPEVGRIATDNAY